MVSLSGRSAIVTGAAVGIGNAYARALAKEGVNVAVCDVRPEIMNLPAQLEAEGVKAVGWIADVSVPANVRTVVDGAVAAFGSIDILINNAGKVAVSRAEDDLDKTLAEYDEIVGTNLKGEFLFGRAVITQLLAQGRGGEIVNIATDHGVTCGVPNELCPKLPTCLPAWAETPREVAGGVMDLYDASKWGLHGLAYCWAKALHPHGIRVNTMCMGATDSHMNRAWNGIAQGQEDTDPEAKRAIDSWMRAEDSAQVVIDLLKEGPEGRTASFHNLCVGRPPVLEPAPPNLYLVPGEFGPLA